jgi:hypothetical protein
VKWIFLGKSAIVAILDRTASTDKGNPGNFVGNSNFYCMGENKSATTQIGGLLDPVVWLGHPKRPESVLKPNHNMNDQLLTQLCGQPQSNPETIQTEPRLDFN